VNTAQGLQACPRTVPSTRRFFCPECSNRRWLEALSRQVLLYKGSPHYYTVACVSAAGKNSIHLQLVNGKFLKVVGTELVLDVSFWVFEGGNSVNYVKTDGNSYISGGGRDWSVNEDRTMGLLTRPELVLGVLLDNSRIYSPPTAAESVDTHTSAPPRCSQEIK